MNQDNKKEYMKAWRERNKEHVRAYSKAYKQLESVKQRRVAETARYRRKKGIPPKNERIPREEILRKANERAKIYYANNKERVAEYKKYWENKRSAENIQHRLKKRLRTRIHHALRGMTKSQSTVDLIGCSIDILMGHLQTQFTADMSWDNYGKWHVDHITPCAMFDLTIPEQQKLCFNYKNLQPLWANENMSKGRKVEVDE